MKANASYSVKSGTSKEFQTLPGYLASFSRKMKNVRAIAKSSVTILVSITLDQITVLWG